MTDKTLSDLSLVSRSSHKINPTKAASQILMLGKIEGRRRRGSSTLAWKIPWTEELGRLQSMGSQRVGHD